MKGTSRFLRWWWIIGIGLYSLVGCTWASAPLNPAEQTHPAAPALTLTSGETAPAIPTTAPLPTLTPVPATATARPTRPPLGWTMYTNPDFVSRITIRERTLWAATLGGVVAWDLDTQNPTLYTTRDGLAEIQANDIVFCSLPNDRIIVAHPSGVLSVYDFSLHKWSQMPITFSDGSTLHRTQRLYCDVPGKRLLVGSAEGLGILDFNTGSWQRIGEKEGLKADQIDSIAVAGQSIWLTTGDQGAYLISGSNIFPFNSESGFPSGKTNDVAIAPDMTVWFGYSTGLVHYRDKIWSSFGSQTPVGIPFSSVEHVAIGQDGYIWIASAQEGICPFDPVTLFCSTIYPGIRGADTTDLIIDQDGTAYAATDGGGILVLMADQVVNLQFNRRQLASNDVLDLASGPSGSIWVATDHGVNRINPYETAGAWQMIAADGKNLLYSKINQLLSTPGGMWFFYDQPQASYLEGDLWKQLKDLQDVSGPIQTAALDQRGYLWLATQQGIRVWDGLVSRVYDLPSGFSSAVPSAFLADGNRMWVGTNQGLFAYEDYQWQVVLPGVEVNTINRGPDGLIYVGCTQGLMRYQDGQGYLWMINLGDMMIDGPNVTAIAWDGSGRLWIGTMNQGAFSFDGEGWEQYNTFSGFPGNRIRKIITDRLGAVWIAAVTGEGGGALMRFVP